MLSWSENLLEMKELCSDVTNQVTDTALLHIETIASNKSTISIKLRAIGDTPKFKGSGKVTMKRRGSTVLDLQAFLLKRLKDQNSKSNNAVVLSIGNGFIPTLEQSIHELHTLFASPSGELTVCYSLKETWG